MTIRHVHLGLGNFFRAHQAWYSQQADDGWEIAAFSGRSRHTADALARQGCAYTLLTRGADGDGYERITSVVRAHPGTDRARLVGLLADPGVAVVTLTVTEAGYTARDDDSTAARLAAGLAARRRAGAGALAVVSCDNLPDNGEAARRALLELADDALADWVEHEVSFVSTVVDRITPRTTDADIAEVTRSTGLADAVPVVTEPFHEWVLSGAFPAGRPAWDRAGAVFTDDLSAFENRKLRLLNGAHSLLAYAGLLRGHRSVAEAIADPACRGWVEQWWDLAAPTVDLPAGTITDYRAALVARFANPRIRHELAQIAADGSQKLPVRVVPVLRAAVEAGRDVTAGARTIAFWMAYLRAGRDVRDVAAPAAVAAARIGVTDVLTLLDPTLTVIDELTNAVAEQLRALSQ